MRRIVISITFTMVLVLAGCGGDSEESPAAADTTAADTTAADTTAADTTPSTQVDTTADTLAGGLDDQFGGRYCEVLAVTVAPAGTTAEVWGTQGLNDCPQAGIEAIDAATVVTELGATIAIVNGPRYWVLDDIVANALTGSGEVRTFGGLEMRSIATVDLGVGIPDRSPYREVSVHRDTEFSFDADREIYELTGPDGSVYVMQSYSVQVDPTLTVDALADLGGRLQLPDGWLFTARVLDEPLVVEDVDGVATVVQDELQNSYQLRSRG